MHVLRLTPHFYWPHLEATGWPVPFDAIGGMQSQIYRQTQKLSQLDVQQTVVTLAIPGAPREWTMDDRVTVRGVRIPVLPIRSRIRGMVDLNVSWSLGVLLDILRKRPSCDLVHAHCSGVLWPPLVGILVSQFLRIPLVLTVHCVINGTYHPMSCLDRMLQRLARPIERAAVRRAAKTILLTPGARDRLLQAGIGNAASLEVVSDCLDLHAFRALATTQAVQAFRKRYELPEDVKIIAFVGRIAREKGWTHLVELAERFRHRPIHLLVCGSGNEADRFHELVRQRKLESHVTITGYVPLNMIPAALQCSNALVLPSVHEEFGGALIEAMAMGVPPVAFSVGGVPWVVRDGDTGILVSPNDVGAMVRALEWLLEDTARAESMGMRAARDVAERFDLAGICHRIHEIYRSVT